MSHQVESGLLTRCSLSGQEGGRRFLELLQEASPELSPERYSSSEPINRVFDPANVDEVLQTWGNSFLWKRTRPKVFGQFLSGWAMVHDAVYLSVGAEHFDVELLISLACAFHGQWPLDFAYSVLPTEEDLSDLNHYQACVEPLAQGLTSEDLKKGLPSLPWGTFLGEPYLELFGESHALATPVFRAAKVEDGLVFLQLTQSVLDCVNARAKVQAVRREAMRHLGEDAFVDRSEVEVRRTPDWLER